MNKKYFKVYFCVLFLFLCDIISKLLVIDKGNILYNKEVIPNFFYIHYTVNNGVAFSLFSGYTLPIIILSVLVLVYLHILIKKSNTKLEIISIIFLMGGVLGNLFDRVFRGQVIDFLGFIIFGYHFPIFNFADIFISIGAILLIIRIIINEKKR